VASARTLVELSASLNTGVLPLGNNLSAPASWGRAALSARRGDRERALATQTLSCVDFFGTSACSGSVTVDTNASAGSTALPAGTYVTLTFAALQGSFGGTPVQFDGELRLDYLSAFDLNSPSFAGLRFQLTLNQFSGTVDGVAFGPRSAIALTEFDGQGVAQLTIDGLRVTGLDTLTVTDADNYALPNVTLRRAHWAAAAGYVDVHYTDWSVVDGRPTFGSQAQISAAGNSLDVTVGASSASSVVYAVQVSVDGVVSTYAVTATYPAGGGSPDYTTAGPG